MPLPSSSIPIKVRPLFILVALLISWMNSHSPVELGVWLFVIFISVLIHELGHALTAVAFGQQARIELVALGGLTFRSGSRLKLWQELLVVFNGPLAGFCLCVLAYLIYPYISPKATVLHYGFKITIYANLFWTILNLIPVQPLDGGKILSILMELIFGVKGIKIALFISMLASIAFTALFLSQGFLIGGLLFIFFAFESFKQWRNTLTMTSSDRSGQLQDLLKSAEWDITQGNNSLAFQKLKQIREQTTSGIIYITATEYLAKLLYDEGNAKDAYELLLPIYKSLDGPVLFLLHRLAFQQKDWPFLIKIGKKVYQQKPDYEIALMNAIGHAQLREEQPAIGWLQRSISEGLPNPKEAVAREEFDPIRRNPYFQNEFRGH